MTTVCIFRSLDDGLRIAVRPDVVEGLLEFDRGCQIVTGNDTYRVAGSWPEVAGAIWPDLFE